MKDHRRYQTPVQTALIPLRSLRMDTAMMTKKTAVMMKMNYKKSTIKSWQLKSIVKKKTPQHQAMRQLT